jgi:hypothetical protein
MVYNPATDFLALWRNIAGQVSKVEMPGLDYVVAALARAGLFTLSVSATAPVANQNTTAWLQTAVPSNSAEGILHLWNPVTTAYAPATAALFLELLEASAGQTGVSWFPTAGGPPINTVGNNGDFAIRTDEPGGIYGPKAAGAWPAQPVPGTTDIIGSAQLDLTFGGTVGQMIYRGPAIWEGLPTGAANTIFFSSAGFPRWEALSTLLDAVFGNARGDILYRGAALWQALAPGATGQVFTTGGTGADPVWAARTAEFPSGTVMLFQQTAAPTGWTKQTAVNDYGLRVTSGAVGVTAGSAFSTVFAQTVVGDTTLSTGQIPSHTHLSPAPGATISVVSAAGAAVSQPGASTTGATGGGGSHNHSINLTLSYVDVIIASKN